LLHSVLRYEGSRYAQFNCALQFAQHFSFITCIFRLTILLQVRSVEWFFI
jgi:hypothetical protein